MSNTFQLQKKKSSGNGEIMCLLRLLFKRNCTAPSWFFFNHSCSFLVFCTRAKLIFLKRKSEYHSLLKIFPKLFFGIKTKSHITIYKALPASPLTTAQLLSVLPGFLTVPLLSEAYSCSMFSPPC